MKILILLSLLAVIGQFANAKTGKTDVIKCYPEFTGKMSWGLQDNLLCTDSGKGLCYFPNVTCDVIIHMVDDETGCIRDADGVCGPEKVETTVSASVACPKIKNGCPEFDECMKNKVSDKILDKAVDKTYNYSYPTSAKGTK